MFTWLKSRTGALRESIVLWRTRAVKMHGIAAELLAQRAAGQLAAAIVHFDQTRAELMASFDSDGVSCAPVQPEELARIARGTAPPPGTNVMMLSSAPLMNHTHALAHDVERQSPIELHVAVAEMYPIPSRDDVVRAFMAALACRGHVCFHCSIDDEVLRATGGLGPGIIAALDKLGWDPDEPIEHAQVARAMRKAQETMLHRSIGDGAAASPAEWLQRYLRR